MAEAQAREAFSEMEPLLPEHKDRLADTAGANAVAADALRSAG